MSDNYKNIISMQREFFATKSTISLEFRIKQLELLKKALSAAIPEIRRALYDDLGRCEFESEFDLGVIDTIDYFIANLPNWVKKRDVVASSMQAPATVYIETVPLGVCLIISPWNYPIELTIAPLLGAISAGNTAIIKTSEYSPKCSEILASIINNTFSANYLHVVIGSAEVAQELLQHQFDHIFYTGGTEVGRKVYQAASRYLTPVVLELGGKSPCIIDETVDYKQTARRILFGKVINSGQTCVAPDYCLVSRSAYDKLLSAFKDVLIEFYPEGALHSKDFSKIISKKHLLRLEQLLKQQDPANIICGGEVDHDQQRISPCLLSLGDTDSASLNPIMQEEIFGPILPIIQYENVYQILTTVSKSSKPLALYIFSKDENFCNFMMSNIQSGGACINDIMVHLFNLECGFGGIGTSGLGAYHGELSFKAYSHCRTVTVRPFSNIDPLDVRFPPYKK